MTVDPEDLEPVDTKAPVDDPEDAPLADQQEQPGGQPEPGEVNADDQPGANDQDDAPPSEPDPPGDVGAEESEVVNEYG